MMAARDDTFFAMVVDVRYTVRLCNHHWKKVSIGKLNCFLGLLPVPHI